MTTKVSFRLAPEFVANASEGILLGDFNNWNPDEAVRLLKSEDGSMSAEIALTSGRKYQYRYFLNDGRWVNDFSGSTTWVEAFGNFVENNVVEVPEISLNDSNQPALDKATPVKEVRIKKTTPTKTTSSAGAIKKEKIQPDDLTKIDGINKKVMGVLKKNQVITFQQLSKATIKNLKLILAEAGSPHSDLNPASWPKQARLAATGNWAALQNLLADLKNIK